MTPTTLVIDLFIVALFAAGVYLFLIAPRQREYRKQQSFVMNIQPGTEVITYGGLIGTVKEVDTSTGVVVVEVAEGIQLRMIAAAVTREFDAEEYAKNAQRVMSQDTE